MPEIPSRRRNSASTSSGRQAEVGQQNQACGTTGRHVSRTMCSRSPSLAAMMVSAASSAILLADRVGALVEQARHVGGIGARRPCARQGLGEPVQHFAYRSFVDLLRVLEHRVDGLPAAVLRGWKKQLRRPVWQAMPPTCSIFSSTTSLSQSMRISRTFCVWPDSSPLCQSLPRERDQYTASPRFSVRASARGSSRRTSGRRRFRHPARWPAPGRPCPTEFVEPGSVAS
jgi:hypothetical protein